MRIRIDAHADRAHRLHDLDRDRAGARVGASITRYARDEAYFATKAAEARSVGDEILATATRVDALSTRVDALAARLATA